MKKVFLPGWGVSCDLWKKIYTDNIDDNYIELPLFKKTNMKKVIDYILFSIKPYEEIHAWSLSALLILNILRHDFLCNTFCNKRIFLYSLPIPLKFKNQDQKNIFRQKYITNISFFERNFIRLLCYPDFLNEYDQLIKYSQLKKKENYISNLNYLEWILKYIIEPHEINTALKNIDYTLFFAQSDAIVNVEKLHMLANSVFLERRGHFGLLFAAKSYMERLR